MRKDTTNDSKRKRWTYQETTALQKIYQEQIMKGRSLLWQRVASRVNCQIRASRRQAIQYRWKNYSNVKAHQRIIRSDRLINLVFEYLPFLTYSQLANCLETSESDIKNLFHSNLIKIKRYLSASGSVQLVNQRLFLTFLNQKNISFHKFRNLISQAKALRKLKEYQTKQSLMKASIQIQYLRIKSAMHEYNDWKKKYKQTKNYNLNILESFKKQILNIQQSSQGCQENYLNFSHCQPAQNCIQQKTASQTQCMLNFFPHSHSFLSEFNIQIEANFSFDQ